MLKPRPSLETPKNKSMFKSKAISPMERSSLFVLKMGLSKIRKTSYFK
jgi:hypothetical protein